MGGRLSSPNRTSHATLMYSTMLVYMQHRRPSTLSRITHSLPLLTRSSIEERRKGERETEREKGNGEEEKRRTRENGGRRGLFPSIWNKVWPSGTRTPLPFPSFTVSLCLYVSLHVSLCLSLSFSLNPLLASAILASCLLVCSWD